MKMRTEYLGPSEKVRNAADARRQGEALYLYTASRWQRSRCCISD